MSAKQRIGFIGLGIMGQSMAGHLLAAGHPLNVFNRSKAKTDDLVAKGAKWFDTIGDLAAESDVIITMVGIHPTWKRCILELARSWTVPRMLI